MKRRTVATVAALTGLLSACTSDDHSPNGPSVTFATLPPSTTSATSATSAASTDASTTAPMTAPPDHLPNPDEIVYTVVASGLERPIEMAWRTGDPDPFVVLQRGTIVRLHGSVVGATVLDVSGAIAGDNEQGLLGLAFHPSQPLAYTYTTAPNGTLTISEYRVGDDGVFDASSRRVVLEIDHPLGNHNGGKLTFGPDGFLYVGVGDGGSANDPDRSGLDVSQLLGKLLRIDPVATATAPYSVPPDNPFVGVAGARPEVWAVGLRNPWRFAFDPQTGDLWIGDVGQNEWEEVDLARADQGGGRGLNFGWSAFEGTHRFNDDQPPDGVTQPLLEYPHEGGNCAVTGGNVYRGDALASLHGWYVFGDYCSGAVWAAHPREGAAPEVLLLHMTGRIGSIATGPLGEIYLLDHQAGGIVRLDPA